MQKNIVLYHKAAIEGNSTETGPLGGTETSVIVMARELAKLGNKVTVICDCKNENIFSKVQYINVKKLIEFINKSQIDIFISQSWLDVFSNIKANIKVFWTGGNHDVKILQPLKNKDIQSKIDHFFFISKWQAENFTMKFNIDNNKIFLTRNGYDPSIFNGNIKKDKLKLIYFSSPSRGLDVLLDVFPKIKKRFKDSELHVFSDYEMYGREKGSGQKEYPEVFKKIDQPGVYSHGNISRNELAKEIQKAYIMAYPTHFRETSCMAAIEAQAAGTVPVTSSLAALSETVQHNKTGILINGNSRSFFYKRKFVKTIEELFNNKDKWKELSKAGQKRMRDNFTWASIAKEWDSFLKNV